MAARVMVMAGGTGGHVFPALAVADELRARGWEVSWLGAPDSFEARVVPAHGFAIDWIHAFRLRGQGLHAQLAAPFRLLRVMAQAWRLIRTRRPDVVLGMGGFVSGPGGLASRLDGRPLVIHEQNRLPGLTNRMLARIATRVLEAFPGTFPAARHAFATGNPVRAEIAALEAPEQRLSGRAEPCRLLIVGGSLGADALNQCLPTAVAGMVDAMRPSIRHQAGRDRADVVSAAYRDQGVDAVVSEFIDDMAAAYAWADLVICRSGALTVSELAAAGLGAVLVPYPHAVDDHQTLNAAYLVDAGAGVLLPQTELTPARLAAVLTELGSDRSRLLTMAAAARRLARPDAANLVAQHCIDAVAA